MQPIEAGGAEWDPAVACDHRGAAPAAGGWHGGGRCSAADELRRQPPASGVRRDALEAEHGGEDLQAAVDLVRAQRPDAVVRVGRRRRAQVLDGAGEHAVEQPQVLAPAVGVRRDGRSLPAPFSPQPPPNLAGPPYNAVDAATTQPFLGRFRTLVQEHGHGSHPADRGGIIVACNPAIDQRDGEQCENRAPDEVNCSVFVHPLHLGFGRVVGVSGDDAEPPPAGASTQGAPSSTE